jgi:beta-glucosidase
MLLTASSANAQQSSTTGADSAKRVDAIVGKMSLEEKIDYIGGTGLDGRAFTYYDVSAKRWHAAPGNYSVQIGSSSEDIRLRSSINLTGEINLGIDQ